MLDFAFSLQKNPANSRQAFLTNPVLNADGLPLPAQGYAYAIATELLSPWQAEALLPEMGLEGYNVAQFVSAVGGPITLTRPQDGVLRVLVAVVPILDALDIPAAGLNTAYATASGALRVRGTGNPDDDEALEPRAILGEGTQDVPEVLAYATRYLLWNEGLEQALAQLNLRYLGLPFPQQAPLLNLYERAALIHDGSGLLFDQKRYLDAAAVLEGGRKLLVTNGQTPDAYAPLLVGYSPPPAAV